MRLTTDRLVIRGVKMTDLDRYHQLQNTEFVLKYLNMWETTYEESREYVEKMTKNETNFVLALKDTDEFIGKMHISEDNLRYDANSISVAYWLGESYARQGYMTEALDALLGWLFREKNYDVVSAMAFAPNVSSIALLKKLGFTQEGYFRHAFRANGVVLDNLCFSMLKEEYHK